MRVIPWNIMECFLEEYSEFFSKHKRYMNYSSLEYLFLKLNKEYGFDVEVENDYSQSR